MLPLAFLAVLGACSSTQHAGTTSDDVYYSAGDQQPAPARATEQPAPSSSSYDQDNSNYNPDQSSNSNSGTAPDRTTTEQRTDENGTTYVTNNYYNEDDYYDYAYSARLRRYYAPAAGYGYYDPYYTNSYWYDYNPYNYGVSIYMGYNWWAPSHCYYDPFWYGPSWSIGFGYSPWYSPYHSYYPYYGYNNYWNGYNHGYNHGYYDGYYNGYNSPYNNPYYYNSYDGTTAYYGPRGSVTSNGKSNQPSPRATLGEKYQRAVADNSPLVAPSGKNGGTVSPRPVIGRGDVKGNEAVQPGKDKSPVNVNPRGGETSPVVTQPGKGSISIKNETGGRPPVKDAEVSPIPEKPRNVDNTVSPKPRNDGGSVRPQIDPPSRGNQVTTPDNSRPRNGVSTNPRNNNGGTSRPEVEQQPRNNNQYSRPNDNAGGRPDENSTGQPRNTDRPRNENVNPRTFEIPKTTTPKVETPRNEQPRNNSYERPRQTEQPKFEQRQEPRQYKQESSPRKDNSSNDNKSGGRRR